MRHFTRTLALVAFTALFSSSFVVGIMSRVDGQSPTERLYLLEKTTQYMTDVDKSLAAQLNDNTKAINTLSSRMDKADGALSLIEFFAGSGIILLIVQLMIGRKRGQ